MPTQQTPTPAIADRAIDATPTPAALFEALTNQRTVLQGQMDQLTSERADLVRQVRNAAENGVTGPGKTGLEDRIAALDKRIAGVDQQIGMADAQVSKAAATPGAIVPSVEAGRVGGSDPDTVIALGVVFMLVVLLPLSIAFARRIWNRGAAAVSAIPSDLMARLQRIEQTVESSGLEIERIGEGQRFVTKLLSERVPALPAKRED